MQISALETHCTNSITPHSHRPNAQRLPQGLAFVDAATEQRYAKTGNEEGRALEGAE